MSSGQLNRDVDQLVRLGCKARTLCIYDAPSPEAIRKTAARNEMPVDQITRVSVLDPYFYL